MARPGPSLEFLDSTDLIADAAALRHRAEREGYLFLRGLLPREAVLGLRSDLLAVVERFGWRAAGQDRGGGTLDVDAIGRIDEADLRNDIGVTHEAYHAVQRLPGVHRLPHHPKLVGLFECLFGQRVLVHPRHIVRMITPHRAMSPTPPHQDFPLIQGSQQTWTAWFPVGDCPRELGSLSVLRASHLQGCLPVQQARGAGGIAVPLCPGETEWVGGDFEAGDVLIFPCFTIHRALACRRQREIRLSMDVRYQPATDPVEEKSLLPHCSLSWEQVYADWPEDDPLRYYWRQQDLQMSPWNPALQQPGRRIC
jgi:hypothetical protein